MTGPDDPAAQLVAELAGLTPQEGPNETPWPGLTAYRFDHRIPLQAAQVGSLALVYVVQGRKLIVVDGQEHVCDPDHHLLLTRGLRFQTRVDEASPQRPYYSFVLQLDPAVVRSVSSLLAERAGTIHAVPASDARSVARVFADRERLRESVLRFLGLLADPGDRRVLAPMTLQEITYHLLRTEQAARLLQAAAVERPDDPLSASIAFARANMSRPLTVGDMADHVNVSPSALTAMFVEATGSGPYQFLKRLRLDQAALLLMERQLTIGQVAERVGYANPSHFATAFKQFHGMTPRKYADAQSVAVAMRVEEATDPARNRLDAG